MYLTFVGIVVKGWTTKVDNRYNYVEIDFEGKAPMVLTSLLFKI